MTELQSHYKQDKPAGVGEIVEVKPYRKMKGSILLLDTNGVRNKGTPVPDKQFLKEINAMLLNIGKRFELSADKRNGSSYLNRIPSYNG